MGMIAPEIAKSVINPSALGKTASLLKAGLSKSKGAVGQLFKQKRAVRLKQCEQWANATVALAKRVHQRLPFVSKPLSPEREAFLHEFVRNRADDLKAGLTLARAVEIPTSGHLNAARKEVVYQVPGIMRRKFNNIKTGVMQRDLYRLALY